MKKTSRSAKRYMKKRRKQAERQAQKNKREKKAANLWATREFDGQLPRM